MSYIAVKGTHDIYGEEYDAYAYINNVFAMIAELYGYKGIETPVLEHTNLFERSTGESSDVVRKEMYTFLDKGERSLTLRPEGTAGVIRSIVEKKRYANTDLPLKVYYHGPVFRYERPQLGRYRQFIQAGVECVGEDSPYLDAECICVAVNSFKMLGFKNIKLKVNTLGDAKTREEYRKALQEYFGSRIDEMCEDCHERLKLNPMRILDCKVPHDQEIVAGAPKLKDYLSVEAEERFYKTLSLINQMDIEYEIDDTLVRGLDYYGQIVFEIHALSDTGKDYGALAGGGHYDGMLTTLGGPSDIDHGVGFAAGVERVYSVMADNGLIDHLAKKPDIYVIPVGDAVLDDCFALTEDIRALGYSCILPYSSSKIGAMFKKADRSGAKFALILGEEELSRGVCQLKNLATKEQKEVEIANLSDVLDEEFQSEDVFAEEEVEEE